jgi:hypothetical protein
LDTIWILHGADSGKRLFIITHQSPSRDERRRIGLEQRWLIAFGVTLLAIIGVSSLATYTTPLAVASYGQDHCRGYAWWTEGLTEQQINEIRQKIWEIRAKASASGWTEEQTRATIHELLAEYNISVQSSGFVDNDGDGVCDRLGTSYGRRGRQGQFWNQTECPWRQI